MRKVDPKIITAITINAVLIVKADNLKRKTFPLFCGTIITVIWLPSTFSLSLRGFKINIFDDSKIDDLENQVVSAI